MDTKRTPLPLLSRPKRLGQPFHGLLRNGRLTLSTGRVIEWPSGGVVAEYGGRFGDCYKLQEPGVPPVNLAPTELASEAAVGREWRNYALLLGTARNYAGINVGINAWLYAAADGTVWRIECDQLGVNTIRPTRRSAGSFDGVYPAGATFTFKVRRFGVVSPDADHDEPTNTHVIYQGWGGEIVSDPLYDNGQVIPLENRIFPGDGGMTQWMPINIEDINSRGDQVIFGVNRSLEQSVSRPDSGRAIPRAWLRVDVAGSGAGISISMSVLQFGSGGTGDYSASQTVTSGNVLQWVSGVGVVPGQGNASVVSGRTSTTTRGNVVAGFFFDGNDTIQSVAIQSIEESKQWSSSGSAEIWGTETDWAGQATAGFTFSNSHAASVRIGPHGLSLPTVTVSAGGSVYYATPSVNTWTFTATVSGGVFGSCVISADESKSPAEYAGWPVPTGVIVTSSISTVAATEWEVVIGLGAGPLGIRSWDGLSLQRISNKVYAVVADMGYGRQKQPTGFKVIAFGTPEGWVSSAALANTLYASFNPGTGEFAYSAVEALGWV